MTLPTTEDGSEVPAGSTSPQLEVMSRGGTEHRGHCVACDAFSDDLTEDTAWSWVDDHRCGVQTVRALDP